MMTGKIVFVRAQKGLRMACAICVFIALCSAALPIGNAQTPSPPQQQGGVSTGDARVYTTKKTTGIVDPKAPVIFEDVTDKSGLGGFMHRSGSINKDYILEVASGGVAIFDYDGD